MCTTEVVTGGYRLMVLPGVCARRRGCWFLERRPLPLTRIVLHGTSMPLSLCPLRPSPPRTLSGVHTRHISNHCRCRQSFYRLLVYLKKSQTLVSTDGTPATNTLGTSSLFCFSPLSQHPNLQPPRPSSPPPPHTRTTVRIDGVPALTQALPMTSPSFLTASALNQLPLCFLFPFFLRICSRPPPTATSFTNPPPCTPSSSEDISFAVSPSRGSTAACCPRRLHAGRRRAWCFGRTSGRVWLGWTSCGELEG